jgi:hypothetical protein
MFDQGKVKIVNVGAFKLSDGQTVRIDLGKITLPCTIPVNDRNGVQIGIAHVDKTGLAKIEMFKKEGES